MSYILDALKKAERERGATQVPTLMTVHDFRSTQRSRSWILVGALVLCAAALTWYFIPALKNVPRHPETAPARAAQNPAAASDDSGLRAIVPSGNLKNEPAAPVETKTAKNKIHPNAAGEAKNASVATAVAGRGVKPPEISVPYRAGETPALPGQAVQPRTVAPPAPAGTAGKPGTVEQKPTAPASFAEAMAMMNLTVLLYSDTPADRIVFINGRKYGEGDHVDGKYLIESINLEGAVLSYQGERAVLKPRNK